MNNASILLVGHYHDIVGIVLMMLGFFMVVQSRHLVKKLIGLSIFQTSVLLIYIASAYVQSGQSPILVPGKVLYVNPLPHVLMLTAIVVGIATLAVGMAMVVRIKEAYDSVDELEILTKNTALSDATHTRVAQALKSEMPESDPVRTGKKHPPRRGAR